MKKSKPEKQQTTNCPIGGQALIEGVMMRGRRAMALAVRNDDGVILLETERIKPKRKIAKFPVIRGIISFFSSVGLGVSVTLRAADAIGPDDEKLSKGAEFFAVIAGLVLALGLFFFLPGVLAEVFYNYVFENILVKSLISGVIRVGLFILYLLLVSKMKDIRRTFMYHGAEHRTINCYERGIPLTVENVQKCSTRHNRCGTTFMFLVMVISIIIFAFAEWGLSLLIPMEKGVGRTAIFMLIKLLLLPLVAGVSYEVLFWFAKLPDNLFARIVRAPGLALQRLTTKIPDDDMVEVAVESFNAVMEMENNPAALAVKFDNIPVENVKKRINDELEKLAAEPVEAYWLLCAVTGKKRSELSGLKYLTRKQYNELVALLEKRKQMPLDYCLGTSSFYGRDVAVDSRVLIPRMETETLCETAINTLNSVTALNADGTERQLSVLDLCTGSGCIALTLCKETRARVVAADISLEALEVAAENLKNTDVEIVQSDMFSQLSDRVFDMIVCNPPYIRSGDIDFLQPEVRCQPHVALDGGEDGLDFYRELVREAPGLLTRGGFLIVEVGFDQAGSVAALFKATAGSEGFDRAEIIKDLEGVDRVVKAYRK